MKLEDASREVAIYPERGFGPDLPPVDVVIPVLHGGTGEDGSIQGLLEVAGLPYVGPGVLGSALGMDKEVQKRLLRAAGIPVADYISYRERDLIRWNVITERLGTPVFVKPASSGSSVGVHKVAREEDLASAVADVFRYDSKLLAEEAVDGRELECAVLGDASRVEASIPGEIAVAHGFYSYDNKYAAGSSAEARIPTDLPVAKAREIGELAKRVFTTLECDGLSRVDMFMRPDGTLVVNEINTLPGFTNISMYPKLWAASGKPTPRLLDELIALAVARHRKKTSLLTSYAAK